MNLKLPLVPLLLAISIPSHARPTVGIELMWGFGESSAKTDGTNSKFCKNRNSGHLKGLGVYISDDNIEAHVSRYTHDTDAENCNRSNWALGIGPKLSTKDDGEQKDLYAEWSPGIVYRLNETWRDHGNWSIYNRLRAGVAVNRGEHHQTSIELGLLHYGGFFEPNHGESFLTLGLSNSDIDRESPTTVIQDEPNDDTNDHNSGDEDQSDSDDNSGNNDGSGDDNSSDDDSSNDNNSDGNGNNSNSDNSNDNNGDGNGNNGNNDSNDDDSNSGSGDNDGSNDDMSDDDNDGSDDNNDSGNDDSNGNNDNDGSNDSGDDSNNNDDGDDNKGHGNDNDGVDNDNPGNGNGNGNKHDRDDDDDEDHDRGHGNDDDRFDDDNPGKGNKLTGA